MNESEVAQQIGELKAMTARTGMLHEAQVFQLKVWPLIVFGERAKSQVEVKIQKSITYKIVTHKDDPPIEPDQVGFLANVLAKWTKELMGDFYRVSVILNGEKLNVSNRKNRKASRTEP
jgi:hypothetical protein